MNTVGAKAGIGRYTRLKSELDQDIFNAPWCEVGIDLKDKLRADIPFVDFFSGAGGISCGLRKAGYEKLLSNEIDKDASATIRRNFPNSLHLECPIEEIKDSELPLDILEKDVPLLIGGPPCQGFSVAGKRLENDPRNQMVHHFLKMVKRIRPWFVVIENVPGILTMKGGAYKEAIIADLAELGYTTSIRILEAADFGVPQLRARAIFVGNRFGLVNPYPKPLYSRSERKPIESAISDLEDLPRDASINHEWTKHSKEMVERISKVEPGESLYKTFRDAWKRQHLGVPSMAIKENHGGAHIHPRKNRVISAREMARLQSFPDDYIFNGTMKRAMWQIGNAVPPTLAQAIGLALSPTINKLRNEMRD